MERQEDVEHLSERMRDTYLELRRLVQPKYRRNPNDEKFWRKGARMIIEHGLDGAHYTRWMYNFYTTLNPMTYPRQITSPKSLQIYLREARYKPADRIQDLKVKINIQFEVVRQRAMLGYTLQDILSDDSLEIGSVVRYVLASRGGLADLACGFRAEAEREIRLEPLYKQILGDKLPLEGG